jgi:hypothetical protein
MLTLQQIYNIKPVSSCLKTDAKTQYKLAGHLHYKFRIEQFFYRFIRKVASRVKKNVGGGHVPPKFPFLRDWLDTNRADCCDCLVASGLHVDFRIRD